MAPQTLDQRCQEKYNARHGSNFKFPSSHVKKKYTTQTKLSLVFLIYSTHLKYWQFNRN